MEEKINIAEILKNKPQGTKLYDLLRNIDVELDKVHTKNVGTYIECTSTNDVGSTLLFDYSKLGTEKCWLDGLQILLPSKGMRDWEKFSWKRGDVLISDCGFVCIFKEWASDDYTRFNGCYFDGMPNARTAKYSKLDNDTAYGYIRELENRCGGKLNFENLKIEKQLEFKDGDIVFMKGIKGGYFANCIFILRSEYKDGDERAFYYAFYNADDKFTIAEYGYTRVHYSLRPATDSEKLQLFDALAKKNKRWDREKKQIVDIKKELQFKPFEKVLVRDSYDDMWRASFFSHIKEDDGRYVTTCITWRFCIPYEGNEHLLGTTDNFE